MTEPQLCVLVWPVSDRLSWRGGLFICDTAASHKGAASFGFEEAHCTSMRSVSFEEYRKSERK